VTEPPGDAVPFLDTDVIIRLVTGDDPTKRVASRALFERIAAGGLTVTAPVTVIADAVHALASPRLYNVPRAEVHALLTRLVRLPHFRVDDGCLVLRALDLYATTKGLTSATPSSLPSRSRKAPTPSSPTTATSIASLA